MKTAIPLSTLVKMRDVLHQVSSLPTGTAPTPVLQSKAYALFVVLNGDVEHALSQQTVDVVGSDS